MMAIGTWAAEEEQDEVADNVVLSTMSVEVGNPAVQVQPASKASMGRRKKKARARAIFD